MIKRKGMIIYANISNKLLEEFTKHPIDISYVNKKRGYIVGYVDQNIYPNLSKKINNFKGVKKVEPSLFEMVEFNENPAI